MQRIRSTASVLHVLSVTALVFAPAIDVGAAEAGANYPARPVTIVVPFPPSGGTDTGARWVAQKLGERWGQSVLVENRPGAGGVIGVDSVARAKPDGYTLLMGNLQTQSVNASLVKSLPYDALQAFAPISLVAELPLVLLVHPTVPAQTAAEFIALARAKPGTLTYSSSGNGGSTHLAASLFENLANVKLVHVPYKGGGPAMQDLIAGHVNLTFLTILEASGHIRAGKVRALAVTTRARSQALADVPTLAEGALPGFDSGSWIGLLAPAQTPRAVVERVERDVREIVAAPEMQARFVGQGAIPVGSTAAAFGKLIDTDRERYAKLIADRRIVPD